MVRDNFAKSVGKEAFIQVFDGFMHVFLGGRNTSLVVSFANGITHGSGLRQK
jgi:hypothetical protein